MGYYSSAATTPTGVVGLTLSPLVWPSLQVQLQSSAPYAMDTPNTGSSNSAPASNTNTPTLDLKGVVLRCGPPENCSVLVWDQALVLLLIRNVRSGIPICVQAFYVERNGISHLVPREAIEMFVYIPNLSSAHLVLPPVKAFASMTN